MSPGNDSRDHFTVHCFSCTYCICLWMDTANKESLCSYFLQLNDHLFLISKICLFMKSFQDEVEMYTIYIILSPKSRKSSVASFQLRN